MSGSGQPEATQADVACCYAGDELDSLAVMHRYQAWIMTLFGPALRGGGTGLEIGAGVGTFSCLLRPFFDRLALLEPADNLIGTLRERFVRDAAVRIVHASLESGLDGLESGSLDAVIMINVLEHIADDALALARCHRVLKRGGVLLLFVPAMPSLFSAMDRQLGHHRRYGKAVLEARVRQAGFEIELLRHFDLLGILPWWLVNKVLGRTAFNPLLLRLYDRFGVPVTRFLEEWIVPPVGKNLIAVGRVVCVRTEGAGETGWCGCASGCAS